MDDNDPIPPVNPFFRGVIYATIFSSLIWACLCLVGLGIWSIAHDLF